MPDQTRNLNSVTDFTGTLHVYTSKYIHRRHKEHY